MNSENAVGTRGTTNMLKPSWLNNKNIIYDKIAPKVVNKKYEMWLTFNAEKSKIQFPVLPECIEIKNVGSNASVDIVGLGEITIRRGRKAIVYSFSSFFPAKKFPGIKVDKIVSPKKLVKKINIWKEKKQPVHFIITGGMVDCYCTIENFTYRETGGDVGSYQYSLELKEYREVEVQKIKTAKKKNSNNTEKKKRRITSRITKKKIAKRMNSKAVPDTYIIKKGDCLYNLAKKFYGDGAKSTKIYNANKKVIGSNPNKIYPGQVLKIPN